MRIASRHVDWWHGYDTLLIENPPRQPPPEEIDALKGWVRRNKALFYVPLPFVDFIGIPPLRHYPEQRWKMAMESLGDGGLAGRTFIDLGSNVGYYAFLAAVEAERTIALDASPLAMHIAGEAGRMYGVTQFEAVEDRIERVSFEGIDVAFAFSCLPYIGKPDIKPLWRVLQSMAKHVKVSFIEMGDGGSELPLYVGDDAFARLFRESGFRKVTNLGTVFASHTNTQRTLWRCDGRA